MAEKYDIFISYRREGGFETAKHIYDRMSHDGYKVSFDIDTLRNGDFDTELLRRIDQCTDFVLILNKGAFDRCLDSSIKRENDWMRNELAYALQKGKNIIPIMLEGFTGFPENLPDDIFRVSRKNGPKYDTYYFDAFYKRLKKFLDTPPPAPRNVAAETTTVAKGAKIYFKTDMDCRILKYGEEIGNVLTTDKGKFIRLLNGNHELEFVSLTNSADRYSVIYHVERNDWEDCFYIKLKSIRDKRVKEEEKETQRILNIPDKEIVSFKDKTISKWGFKVNTGEIIIFPKYDDARKFSEGLAGIALNDKWGYIDKTGKEITLCKYDGVYPFSRGLAIVKINGKKGYIDKTGREITLCKYDGAHNFSEGLAVVTFNGKKGYIDKTGKEITLCKYDDADDFSEGLAVVKFNGKKGYIDRTGREIIPCKYDDADGFSKGLAGIALNGKWGYIDKTGKNVIPIIYDFACSFLNGRAFVKLNGKMFHIDKTGKRID